MTNQTGWGCEYDPVTGQWVAWIKYSGNTFTEKFTNRESAERWLQLMANLAKFPLDDDHAVDLGYVRGSTI